MSQVLTYTIANVKLELSNLYSILYEQCNRGVFAKLDCHRFSYNCAPFDACHVNTQWYESKVNIARKTFIAFPLLNQITLYQKLYSVCEDKNALAHFLLRFGSIWITLFILTTALTYNSPFVADVVRSKQITRVV